MARTKPKERVTRKRKVSPPAKRGISFTLALLILMLVVALVSGFVAYTLGQDALQRVKPIPSGGRLPKVPNTQPSQKSSQANQGDKTNSTTKTDAPSQSHKIDEFDKPSSPDQSDSDG